MTFSLVVKSRLGKLGRDQKDLARAAQVTDSYISQLLGEKKAPPARDRTDIYPKMEAFLHLAPGELGRLAEIDRAERLKRRLGPSAEPLFQQFRDLVLRKCVPEKRAEVGAIFQTHPFGILERLVAQKLLAVVQGIARQELDSENWVRLAAQAGGRSREAMRVMVLEFLDADVFQVSSESCVNFLDPLVKSWEVDLETIRIDIHLEGTLAPERRKTFAFVESEAADGEPALSEFLQDPILNDRATEDEILRLREHRFNGRAPTKLYYYRALQNLRDPLHFVES